MSAQNDLPTGCNTDDGPTDGPALDADRTGPNRTNRLGRRTFVKGLGASAAGALALGYDNGPVGETEAVAPLVIAGAVAAGSFAAGAVGGVAYGATFMGPDDSEVAEALNWDMAVNEFTRFREDNLSLSETLASLSRDVQLVENKAREDAIFAVFEQGVDSGSQSDAEAAAIDAIDDAYATVERSIINSFSIRAERFDSVALRFLNDTDESVVGNGPYFETLFDSMGSSNQSNLYYGSDPGVEVHSDSVELVDGSSVSISHVDYYFSDFQQYVVITPVPDIYDNARDRDGHLYGYDMLVPDPDGYDTVDESDAPDFSVDKVVAIDSKQWVEVYRDLLDRHDALITEVSDMVDAYYQPAADGEIDLFEAVGPAHLTETASNPKDYQEAAMALRAMGYPMSRQVVTVSVPAPEGVETERVELVGRLSWTAHGGNALPVGSEIVPGNVPGSIFAALNMPEDVSQDADILEVTGPFVVESAEGSSEVTFEDRSLAESEMTNEEIVGVFQENYTANLEATENVHDTATGGGGGWDISNWSNTQIGAALVAAAIGLGIISK